MQKLFVDTNIFVYTLFSVDTKKQNRCVTLFRKAEQGKVALWTTPWVIAELVWFLQRQKLEKEKIAMTITKILATRGLEVENRHILLEVMDIWKQANDFIDCVNVVLAEDNEVTAGFSYDKDLDTIPHFKRVEP